MFDLQSCWLFGARCSVLFMFPYCLIIIFTLLTPTRTVWKGTHPITWIEDFCCCKFHHFKIIYFQPKVWAAFLLGILSMILHYSCEKLTMSEQWMLRGKSDSLGSGPCLLLQQTSASLCVLILAWLLCIQCACQWLWCWWMSS